jgi:signal transduction histidine kinase
MYGPIDALMFVMVGMRRSVFGKLVAIMIAMAATLLLLVGGFFWFLTNPTVVATLDRVLDEQARAIVAASPDEEAARRLGARLGFDVRFEGPAGGWSTAADLPTFEDVRQRGMPLWSRLARGRHYYVLDGPRGGTYLFAWRVPRAMLGAHATLLVLVLLMLLAVVLTAHTILKRLLEPLRSLNEAVGQLAAGNLDITLPRAKPDEFGRLTEAFNRMVARVREMIAAREQLLVDVSHELRSPLTRLKVALELTPVTDQRAGMASDLAEMEALIAELLELERLRGGHGIRRERQNLLPIIREVATTFAQTAPGVAVLASSADIPVDVDVERVRMVLRNLIGNAVKYSLADSRAIEISTGEKGDRVLIKVTDDGPGIPEGDLANLFEPFFRVDRSRSKATGGYGLGLAIAKRIVEAHGGTISAGNNITRGATFTVSLPKPA